MNHEHSTTHQSLLRRVGGGGILSLALALAANAREITVTAYCPCTRCCGQWAIGHAQQRTASGTVPVAGRTVAATRDFAIGQRVTILGRTYIVEDRMSRKFKRDRIDIFFDNHKDAVKFGVKKVGM